MNVVCNPAKRREIVGGIRHEAASHDPITSMVRRWQPAFERQIGNRLSVGEEQQTGNNDERVGTPFERGLDCSI